MSEYFTYVGLTANTVARASDVNSRFAAIETGLGLLPASALLKENRITYAVDTGVANAYVAAPTLPITAYNAGLNIILKVLNANTGASTVNVSGLGVKQIIRSDGTALQLGDIVANQILNMTYDGTAFRLAMAFAELSPAGVIAKLALGGNVTLGGTINATGYLLNGGSLFLSPALTGVPTAPTAAPGTNTDQIATTAFVTASQDVASGPVTLTDGPVITIDGATGDSFDLTIAGNRALASPTNMYAGHSGRIRITQGAGGGHTLTYGANWNFVGGTPVLSTTAGAIDIISYYADTASLIDAVLFKEEEVSTDATAPITLTDGATITIVGTTGDSFNVTLGGNRTLANPTGMVAGQSGRIRVKQDATGGRTLAFGGNWTFVGPDPILSTAPNTIDIISYFANSPTDIEAVLFREETAATGGFAPLNSPAFTGVPTAPTAAGATNTTQLATTAFVQAAVPSLAGYALLASPSFSGVPTGPTATGGTNTTQLATTAFVQASVPSLSGYAPLASPALTGTPTAPTASLNTSTTQVATTSFVITQLGQYAPIASPTFTGTVTITTVATADNSTKAASTAYVKANLASYTDTTALNSALALKANLAAPALTGNATIDGETIGFRGIPIVFKSASFTVAAVDNGKGYSYLGPAGAATLATDGYPTGYVVTGFITGADTLTLTRGAGVSLFKNGGATDANVVVGVKGRFTLICWGGNVWTVDGTNLT